MSIKEPPKDFLSIVYLISLLNGMGGLLPWNMFIMIAPQYYVDYWFTQNDMASQYAGSFMSFLSLASQLPNVSFNILNVILVIGWSLFARIIGPLVINCICVGIVIAMAIFCEPALKDMTWFYAVTMCLVVIMNIANGFYTNSCFGLFADFPPNYINAFVLGSNICGLVTAVLSILCATVLNDIRSVAILYFTLSLAVLLTCLFSIFLLKRLPYFLYFEAKGIEAREAGNSTKPSWTQIRHTIQNGWPQFINVFLVFFITLSLYPAVLADSTPVKDDDGRWPSVIPENIYDGLIVFLNFATFATTGSLVAGFWQWPTPRFLWIGTTSRALFIPFFLFCPYLPADRKWPILIHSEWIFAVGNSLMAFTSGYFSSLAMMYAPKVVPEALSKTAGMISALCLIGGITSGILFTFVLRFFVTHI
ncbi:unnamed protein product, partial [Mesorhabditis belari]|uniref:Equilibrative nucleoside transporter n=1 Tax=Mesorhabditis belari TaxID=2138241 RepID=A0AAF3EQL5_9BILA